VLAILSTHPIQYQVPLWQALAKGGTVPFEVWYLSDHATRPSFDSEFNQTFAWDIEMLGGYPYQFLKTNNNHDVARFSQLRLAEPLMDHFRKKKVTALWIQGWQVAAYWQAARQSGAMGIPVWIRGESNDLAPVPLWKKPIKQIALRHLFSNISDFLYIGAANRRFYKNFGVRDEHLHPAYYCVDNERFKRQADALRSQRAEIRREWRIPEDSFCMLFAGKFISKKRPLDVVNAATRLRDMNALSGVHLLFAGSGELGGVIRQSCNVLFDAESNGRASISNSVNGRAPDASFTGFLNQTEISKAYVAADCLVLASDYRETWGLVVNEAMASGLPCVVSDACGCGEDLIDPIEHAFRFSVGDSNSLAEAVLALINCTTPSSVWRAHVNRFDLTSSVATVSELYRRKVGTDTRVIPAA
jgi:glycosyltransferase involved in cell wall biosynthesis